MKFYLVFRNNPVYLYWLLKKATKQDKTEMI